MADSVCEVERNRNKKILLMSENGEFVSGNREKPLEDNGLNNLKGLFYLGSVEKKCFSKYSVADDGVNRASEFCPDVHGFSSEYKGLCPNNDENCRKKRCSDRYDSSESSDSGIAVSSSASSGTSDITDPGSPFSTSSDDSSSSPGKCKVGKRCKSEEKSPAWSQPSGRCRSEEKIWTEAAWEGKQQSDKTDHNFITPETDFKMAPNIPSASSPCDIWTSITENDTANDTAHFNHFKTQSEVICNKRLKVDAKDSCASLSINNAVVNVPSPIVSEPDVAEVKKSGVVKSRRLSYDAKVNASDSAKYKIVTKINAAAPNKGKQDRNRHQGKITEYFKSQMKTLGGMKREFGGGKKDLKAGASIKPEEPPVKKMKTGADDAANVPVFVKPSPKPTTMPSAEPRPLSFSNLPKCADFLLKKSPETKTLFNKILQNHKNRKLAENYLKCRTVPKPKPATNADADASSHKPYDTSTRSIITEMPNASVVEINLENKVQSKELDSNFLNVVTKGSEVTKSEVISKRSDGAESEKSPILSAPTTIRFPATCHNNQRVDKHRARESIECRWDACSAHFDSPNGLLEHLQSAHVLTQVSGEKFVCLWVGCKVFDQKSCSRSWLERHVLSHAGNKPFRCIVDGCGQGFSTQAILERHVNNHFAADVKKALDSSIVHKLFRRNGKKLRYRRQPWSARMFDFFDSGIMERLEHRLVQLTKARTGGNIADIPGKSLALTSQVIARRMTENGRQQFLLRWFPENIVEDEWVYEKEITRKKTVSIPSLSPSVSSSLQETLELVMRSSSSYRKARRKNRGTTPSPEPVEEKKEKEEKEEEPVVVLPPVVVEEKVNQPEPKSVQIKTKTKKKKKEPKNLLPASVDVADGSLTTEKTVSLRPKEESLPVTALPEDMSVVPVCPPPEETMPVQTGGFFFDSTKLVAPIKTGMIVGSPFKLVTSQYIEQPFVHTVMPVQMPVTYQIPIVKLSSTSGMFFPQIPNYIIPPQPPVFSSSVPFRNGFSFSTTGTIQIQASTTTLQHTASSFMQSTNTSGFQIVQSPNMQQSIVTAYQNTGMTNLNLKSPTVRLFNCQPLILNHAKPMSMTVTSIANPNANALAVPTVAAMPLEQNNGKVIGSPLQTKKLVKQKLNILPKPNLPGKGSVADGANSNKQCLQSCGPGTGTAT